MRKFTAIIAAAVREGFSDVHITGGHPMVYRKNGRIQAEDSVRWTPQEVDGLVRKILTPGQLRELAREWSSDLALSVYGVRLRLNVFNTTRGLSLAIRLLPGTIPTIDKLNLHPSMEQIAGVKAGLVLMCGATGSGKSTTIAAVVDEINRSRAAHIVTLEDPIEYRYLSKRSFIEQRELGTHVPTFEKGLLDILREDPDVIVVGELREPEVMRLTLNAAESGHLVIASLHATNAEDALYRLCNSFPVEAQEEIRFQLASTLQWILIQQLVYQENIGFRIPVLSIVRGTQAVKGLIRENKIPQIESAIQMGKADGMFTMERYLRDFIGSKKNFVPPSENFRPSPEVSQDIIYTSPLVDPEGGTLRPRRPIPVQEVKPAVVHGQQADLGPEEHVHSFDEKATVDELIAQIKNSTNFKE
jgi:twitching motility protein PilT